MYRKHKPEIKKIRKDWSGNKFGKLLLLAYKYNLQSRQYYLAKCDCGIEKIVPVDCVRKGTIKTCNTCPKPTGKDHVEWQGVGEISKCLWNYIEHSAKIRNYEFSINIKYAWELFLAQNRRCALTGWEISFEPSYKLRHTRTASLDRKDNNKGYVEGNVQWLHRKVNRIKHTMHNDDFISMCKDITKNNDHN